MSKLNNSVHRDKSKAVGPKTVYEWTDCVNGGDVLQTRRENGTSRRTYYWSKGDKPERLVYHARFIPSGPNTLVWTEGAHCARFASAKLPPDSFDVVAFVSCSILPDIQALRSVALGSTLHRLARRDRRDKSRRNSRAKATGCRRVRSYPATRQNRTNHEGRRRGAVATGERS